MGKRVLLAVIVALLSSTAFAEHAFTLEPSTAEPGTAPAAAQAPATPPAVAPVPQPAPQAQVALPSELDVYLVPAATREVCTVSEWGFGEIRRDCRTEPVPVRRSDPALRGLCITRYGHRACY